MARSKARLAADWFAKLRLNQNTQTVVHDNVQALETEIATISSADIAFGSVGSYAWLSKYSNGSPITSGLTYAGSALQPAAMIANLYDDADTAVNDENYTMSGTWRAMGGQTNSLSDHPYNVTLFVRIA